MARRSPAIDDEMLFRGLREGQVQAETVVTDQVQFTKGSSAGGGSHLFQLQRCNAMQVK